MPLYQKSSMSGQTTRFELATEHTKRAEIPSSLFYPASDQERTHPTDTKGDVKARTVDLKTFLFERLVQKSILDRQFVCSIQPQHSATFLHMPTRVTANLPTRDYDQKS